MHLEGDNSKSETSVDARDLTCPICMSIADDPQLSSCCQRVFCLKDANTSRYDNGCPLCRKSHYTFEPSAKHRAMLDQLTIKCACSERLLPTEYESHLERCSNVTFVCPHSACREKNETATYNSQQLVNHLARAHCDEVPVLGSTFVNKKSLEPYRKAAEKYEELVATLYNLLYPKMLESHLKASPKTFESSPAFKCAQGHRLLDADASKRKRKNGTLYSSPGYNCDRCHRSFSTGQSWHCSCSESGYDVCIACIVFQLFELNNDALQQASQDNEEQQQRFRRRAVRNTLRLPRGLFRLLTGSMDEDEDDEDTAHNVALRRQSNRSQQHGIYDGPDDDEIEVNLRED